MSFKEFQGKVWEWKEKNKSKLGNHKEKSYRALLGMVEEQGELTELLLPYILLNIYSSLSKISHHHLKKECEIRETEDHTKNAKDAIGDLCIFLIDYCNLKGWDLQTIVTNTWIEVEKRDWNKNPNMIEKRQPDHFTVLSRSQYDKI